MSRIKVNRIDLFWQKVDRKSYDECWNWLAGLHGGKCKQYGLFWDGNKTISAHRFSYSLHFGEIPGGICVCHKCDNPSCVNPHHLFLGTHQDNEDDKLSKNRQAIGIKNGMAGTKNWNNKLSVDNIIQIRKLYDLKVMNQKELSNRFGVKDSQISRIINRKRWAWL